METRISREKILTAMGETIHTGRWSQLCERYGELDGGEVFHALFPIAADAQRRGPAFDAACLLFSVNPACPISCKDAIRAMLPRWEISIEETPWYLACQIGEVPIRRAIEELSLEPLGPRERMSLDTVLYWAEIFFALTPEEIQGQKLMQVKERERNTV